MGRTDLIIGKRNYRVISRVFSLRIWLALPLAPSLLALHYFCMASRSLGVGEKQRPDLRFAQCQPQPTWRRLRFAAVLPLDHLGLPAPIEENTKKKPRRSGAKSINLLLRYL